MERHQFMGYIAYHSSLVQDKDLGKEENLGRKDDL